MGVYSVEGRTSVLTATANHALAAVWNQGTNPVEVRLLEFGYYRQGDVGERMGIQRLSARGTPATTSTPDAENAWDADAPRAGVLLDLGAYSVQPTRATNPMTGWNIAGQTGTGGSGYVAVFRDPGLRVPGGRGVALIMTQALAHTICSVYAVWSEA